MPNSQARRTLRRTEIVTAAAAQFAESGYPAVGMDQIGAAAGITGPAIYRHFDSKAAVLAAVFDGIIDAVTASPQAGPSPATQSEAQLETHTGTQPEAHQDGPDDGAAELGLGEWVQVYAAAVAARRRLMAVFVREVHHLPPEHRSGLELRQRALIRRWRTLLAEVHPDWDEERVRTAVHGCFGMLNAVGTFDSPLPDAQLTEELVQLARRALGLDA